MALVAVVILGNGSGGWVQGIVSNLFYDMLVARSADARPCVHVLAETAAIMAMRIARENFMMIGG